MTRPPALCLGLLLVTGCLGGKEEHPYVSATGGDPKAGAETIRRAGCGACHRIPGIREAHGVVASPLTTFRQRTYIAGELPNTPENLVRWLVSPHEVEPRTAMPELGLDTRQARNVAAYLYSHEE